MSSYKIIFQCSCGWYFKTSSAFIRLVSPEKDLFTLVGMGLSASEKKCPKCGKTVFPLTSKELE